MTVARRAGTRHRRLGNLLASKHAAAYLLLLPGLVIHVGVIGVPSVLTLGISTLEWDLTGPMTFVGLENYRKILFEDEVFFTAFTNNLRWLSLSMTVPLVAGLGAAVLISKTKRAQLFYRTAIFIAYIFPTVVVARLWQMFYHPFFGINQVLESAGLDWAAKVWLGDPQIALYAVAFAWNWHWWAFPMVIFLAALQQIDRAYYEAAAIEGAGDWQLFYFVTLPLLRPTLVFVVLMSLLWGFITFDYVFVMTRGGPANSSEVMSTWIITQAIDYRRMGYASALATAIGLITGAIIVCYIYLRRRGLEV